MATSSHRSCSTPCRACGHPGGVATACWGACRTRPCRVCHCSAGAVPQAEAARALPPPRRGRPKRPRRSSRARNSLPRSRRPSTSTLWACRHFRSSPGSSSAGASRRPCPPVVSFPPPLPPSLRCSRTVRTRRRRHCRVRHRGRGKSMSKRKTTSPARSSLHRGSCAPSSLPCSRWTPAPASVWARWCDGRGSCARNIRAR